MQRQAAIQARTWNDLLNEAFIIYGRHLWRLIGMAALVQVPATVALYSLLADVRPVVVAEQPTIDGPVLLRAFAALIVWSIAATLVFATVVCAVGQHYLSGRVSVGQSFSRALRGAPTLALLAAVLPLTLVLGLSLIFLLAIPLIIAVIILVFWSMGVPAAVVEGSRLWDALRRSQRLVSRSWWRTFGIGIVVGLVGIGLGILVTVPFLIISAIPAVEDHASARAALEVTAQAASASAVLPIITIAWTLLYYDLRVRKESYNVQELTREMGTAVAR